MGAPWIKKHSRVLWTAALILAFVPAKVMYSMQVEDMKSDGSQYLDVAKHLVDGDGYVTSVSPFHQGLPYFPHPSSLYPAWTLLVALLLTFLPLRVVAVWVPSLLFFVAFVCADRFGRRLWPQRLPWPLGFLDGGHAMLLCCAAAVRFFEFTSVPFTEGLSYTLAFLFVVRLDALMARTIGERFEWRSAVEIGLWLALLLYLRAQFLLFVLALAATLGIEALLRASKRTGGVKQIIVLGAVASVVFAAAFMPFILWMRTFIPHAGLNTYFRFDLARVVPVLTKVVKPIERTFLGNVLDRLEGARAAFDPSWVESYWHSFGLLIYLLPLLLIAAVSAPRSTRDRIKELLASPRRAWWLFLLVFAGGALASIHSVHKTFSYDWYFASRHSLVCLFAIVLAALFALASPWRIISLVAAVLLVGGGVMGLVRDTRLAAEGPPPVPSSLPVQEWLERIAQTEERVVVAGPTNRLRVGSWQLSTDLRRRVGRHITYEPTTKKDLKRMATRLNVRWFLAPEDSSLRRKLDASSAFVRTSEFGEGPDRVLVYEVKDSARTKK